MVRGYQSLSALVALAVLVGCPSGSPRTPDSESTGVDAAVDVPVAVPEPSSSVALDTELDALLGRMASECKFVGPGGSPRACAALDKEADKTVHDHGIDTLDTLTEALLNAPRKKRLAAGWLILTNYPSSVLGPAARRPQSFSEESVRRLLDAVRKNRTKGEGAHTYSEVAVNLAVIKGMNDEARAMIDALDDETVKGNAIKGLMRYGRLNNIELVKKYAADPNPTIRKAALGAPATISQWSNADKRVLCPWMLKYLPEPHTQILANAMLTCGGEYIDKLLDEAEVRVRAGTYKRPFAFAIREVCSRTFFGQKKSRSPEQCERTHKFLTDLVENTQAAAAVRAFALSSIAYSWRDAQSLKLMRRYEKSKNPELRKAAKREIEFLRKRMQSKKK